MASPYPAIGIALAGHFSRKPSSWREVGRLSPILLEKYREAIHALPVFPLPYLPLADLPAPAAEAMVFVGLGIDGVRFLISTEGSSYCRYAVRLS